MGQIVLPPRLAAIADLVPDGARLADVGTDHALLPISLLLSGRIVSAVAADIRPGPLSRAESNAKACGVKNIRFELCDGLDRVSSEDADTVVIAGMGGENISGILERAPWARDESLLLLQPMSRPEELRRALCSMNIEILSEKLVEDNGRIYSVICARGGIPADFTPAELYIGRFEQIAGEPLFLPYLSSLEQKLDAALKGLSRSDRPSDADRFAVLKAVREELSQMRCRYADGF